MAIKQNFVSVSVSRFLFLFLFFVRFVVGSFNAHVPRPFWPRPARFANSHCHIPRSNLKSHPLPQSQSQPRPSPSPMPHSPFPIPDKQLEHDSLKSKELTNSRKFHLICAFQFIFSAFQYPPNICPARKGIYVFALCPWKRSAKRKCKNLFSNVHLTSTPPKIFEYVSTTVSKFTIYLYI